MRKMEISNVGLSATYDDADLAPDQPEIGPKPGLFRAIHGTQIVAEFSTSDLKTIPHEGGSIKLHGSLWIIGHVSWCYSVNLDSFDVVAEVRPVQLFWMLFGDEPKALDLLKQAADTAGLSEFAYIKAACRIKQSVDVVLRDEEKAATLKRAMGAIE